MIVTLVKSIRSYKIKFIYHSLYYLFALFLHLCLVNLFSSDLYVVYFITLFLAVYLLHFQYRLFSKKIFIIYSILLFLFSKTTFYEDVTFQIYLYFDIFHNLIYTDNQVTYTLSLLHFIIIINKKVIKIF